MNNTIKQTASEIIRALNAMKKKYSFNPGIYIGKTSDFLDAYSRHQKEGLPILLRVAEGSPKEISDLEAALNKWAIGNKENWNCLNKNCGSTGNPDADKLYICLDTSADDDGIYEYDEKMFLGTEYPIQI